MAITNAQQYKQLLAKGGRIGLKGGADASTKSFQDSYNRAGGPKSTRSTTKDSSVNVGAGGANTRGDDGRNDNLNVPSSDTGITQKEKEKYEKQFFDKGEVPPLGSRPTSLKTKIDQRNKQKRLNYINTLIANRRNKINKGLIDYQDEFGQFEGLTDFDELEDYIGKVQSVQDLVDKGFYKSDGRFAKGDIPDFNTTKPPGLLSLFADKFDGPITSDRLNELMTEMDTLKGLKTTDGLESTNFNELMETYQPNRFKLENPEPSGNDNNQQQTDPCLGPNPPAYCAVNNDPTEEDATPSRNLGGLAPRFAGSIFDFTGLADGGRAGMMDGGMMEDTPEGGIMDLESGRQMYFLGKLVKKATRAVKKVAKSPIGKAALLYFGGGALGNLAGGSGLGGMFKGAMSPGQFFTKNKLANVFTKGGAKNILFGGQKLMGNAAKNNFVDFSGILGSGGKFSLGKTLGLSLGVPFALDALGVGKEDDKMDLDEYYKTQGIDIDAIRNNPYRFLARRFVGMADGGRINYQEGGDAEPVAKKTMPLLDMDGMEKDYREDGGFVPIGRMERADDVPARLSKNEFVFTADAVRNAGEGDIDKGAEVMYNMMKNLESGGEVSKESQGLDGAREMFKTSKRLEEVL